MLPLTNQTFQTTPAAAFAPGVQRVTTFAEAAMIEPRLRSIIGIARSYRSLPIAIRYSRYEELKRSLAIYVGFHARDSRLATQGLFEASIRELTKALRV